MGKFVIRIGWCGFVVACALFAATQWLGHSAGLDHLLPALWPTSILLASRRVHTARLTLGTSFALGFSALMNAAFYAGLAWLAWWAARLAGIVKSGPSAKARVISFFLALGLGFSALVALAETAFHLPSKFTARSLLAGYLVSANLFALIVLTCALAGWALFWLRDFLVRRGAAIAPRS